MTHSEEPLIDVVEKSLLETFLMLQIASPLYTDGVVIVAMLRVIRKLLKTNDDPAFVKKQFDDLFADYGKGQIKVGEI